MAYREITGSDSWDFEKDKVLEGTLVLKETAVGAHDSNRYHFKLKDDSQVGIWGSSVLDSRLGPMELGSLLRITFLGKVRNPKSGREYKDYKVEVDDFDDGVD